MIFQIFISILLIVLVQSKKGDKSKQEAAEQAEQARLTEFFAKYCKETDKKILATLEKCEEGQPKNMKEIELECVKKVLNKSENPSYNEIQDVECNDELGVKFDDCEAEKMQNMTMNESDKAKMVEIARKIMFCGFDCYGIKHE